MSKGAIIPAMILVLGVISPAYSQEATTPAAEAASVLETGLRPLKIEAKHSSVIFYYPHFGLSRPSGKIMGAEGQIVFDREHPERSSVDVTLDLNSLVTGLPEFDQLLKGPDYFDVVRFPQAHFVSRAIAVTAADTANITGDLTLHGVTKSVVLAAKFNKRAFNPALFKTGTGFSATGTLSRADFGLGKLGPFVGDDITLQIEVEAY